MSDLPINLLEIQKKVEEIARHAGEYAFVHWSDVEAIQKGTSGDIVTEVDRVLESQIKNELSPLIDGALLVGEEEGGETNNGYVWVIDPIDGTKHYAYHMPSFYVQICLLYENKQ